MNIEASAGQTLVENIRAATTGSEIASAIADAERLKDLGGIAQREDFEKAIRLIANSDPNDSMDQRLKRLVLMAAFAEIKAAKSIVELYAPRALAGVVVGGASSLSVSDKEILGKWLENQDAGWIEDFAIQTVVTGAHEEKVCLTYLSVLARRIPDLGALFEKLRIGAQSTVLPRGIAQVEGRKNLCASIARVIKKYGIPTQKELPRLLKGFVVELLLQGGEGFQKSEKDLVAESISELLIFVASQYPEMILSDPFFEIIGKAEKEWVSKNEKKWKRFRSDLFFLLEQLVTVFAVSGSVSSELLRKARMIESASGETLKMCNRILERNEIASEDVVKWLLAGGTPGSPQSGGEKSSLSENESLAHIMLLADELASVERGGDGEMQMAVADNLITEVRQFSQRKGLELDGTRDSSANFDPIRHRSSGPVEPGGLVTIRIPGVIRKAETRQFQVLQAIVEPSN